MIFPDQSTANFDRSNAASAKALANDATLSIDELESSVAAQLGLSAPVNHGSPASKTIARAVSDAIAVVAANHKPEIHRRWLPQGRTTSTLFNEMERARCEAIGARQYQGVASNLHRLWQRVQPVGRQYTLLSTEHLPMIVAYLTRHSLNVTSSMDDQLQQAIAVWSDALIGNNASLWKQLPDTVNDQARFAQLSLAIIASIEATPSGASDHSDLIADGSVDEDSDTGHTTDTPDSDDTESQQPEDESNTDEKLTVELRDDAEPGNESLLAANQESDNEDVTMANRDAPVSADAENAVAGGQLAATGYTVFSSAEDEIVAAADLCSGTELNELRDALDKQIERHAKVVGRLSGRLQRVLMSQQQRHWIFDLETGTLDTTRLTRVVTDPLSSLSFKTESDTEFPNTTVTLLVDNSKSMLGKPIAIAAACADLLSQTLERCGVATEILGFTTTRLHGGELFNQWQESGAAKHPGRLNGTRHIIYKSADTPYRRARKNFGLMLMKDLLKQNIDGEALLWAHNRLLQRPEQRRILMVISDGAPIDTSTMSANSKDFLSDHLHQVIRSIEKRGAVELLAIGIGHDVTQYYKRAMKIMDARDLSKSMLAHLTDLFAGAKK